MAAQSDDEIIEDLKQIVADAVFDRMSAAEIDDAICERLRELKALGRNSSSSDLALQYAEKMKRPRADKHRLGGLLKDAVWGL